MKERPILFSGPMVRAILDGTKTQTRRVVKGMPFDIVASPGGGDGFRVCWHENNAPCYEPINCRYGHPGDRLWVKETHGRTFEAIGGGDTWSNNAEGTLRFRADYRKWGGEIIGPVPEKWKPSIFMRREYSRITLEVVYIRVERLNEISEADCQAEGAEHFGDIDYTAGRTYKTVYRDGWESINGNGSWALNPWVWVVDFVTV